jgi:hypothetical protein
MSTELVNLEEQGRRIARISGAISMINESSYIVRSKSRYDTYNIIATKSERVCSCPDYACHNAKCKHVFAVEFYRH